MTGSRQGLFIKIAVGVFTTAVLITITVNLWTILRTTKPPRNPALRQIAQLEMAIAAYQDAYQVLPFTVSAPTDEDERYDRLISTHAGGDETTNPRQIRFLADRVPGEFRDPWGQRFRVLLDTDYDGKISMGTKIFEGSYLVWSIGPNGRDELGKGDDIMR